MTRLTHAAVTLLVTLVAYQAYVFTVVPLVEPALPVRTFDPATEAEWQGGWHAVARYQKLLANYFPQGHWALDGSPQVYEYGPIIFVLEDFKPLDGGRVELTKSLLVAFPTPRVPGAAPPRDAIVVELPDRSVIRFDQFDPGGTFASGKIGRPIEGVFPGSIVVRSDMQEAGAADDLRMTTRDLRFNQSMLWTSAEVAARIGRHQLDGRHLELRFITEDHAGASDFPIVGVDTLEIHDDIRVRIDTAELGLDAVAEPPLRGRVASGGLRAIPRGVRQVAAEEPIDSELATVTCEGSLQFDFTRFVASLRDNVLATLPRADSRADQLACSSLQLHFGDGAGVATAINPRDEPDLARRQAAAIGRLRPERVEAIGKPVRIDSPSRQAAIRGERLVAWVNRQKLRIEGTPATLAQGLSEARAALLEYEIPAKGSGHAIGDLTAAGPGWLRLVPSNDDPQRAFQARWNAAPGRSPSVTIRRDARGAPLLKIVGRPEIAAVGVGRLQADQVTARLAEVAADGPNGPAIELGGAESALLIRRVDATGAVDFSSEQFTGRADNLTALVRAAPANATEAGPRLTKASGNLSARTESRPDGPRYDLRTRDIQVDVGLTGERVVPLGLICDGGVRLEQETTDPAKTPLRVVGQQLRIDRLDRPGGARLTLAGSSSEQADALAEVQSDDLRVWVRDLHIDQAASRAWTEGEGRAVVRMPPSRDAARRGEVVRLGGEATLRWRGGMEFDGQRLTVSDEVFAESTEGWLRCQSMAATLTNAIDLAGSRSARGPIDLARIDCNGGVTIDYRTSDTDGQRSHERARLQSLTYDRRNGAIAGQGPGSLRSARLANGGLLSGADGANASLQFLRVDFRDDLAGSVDNRQARFRGDVQAVYGPILAWEQQLPLRSPDGVPPDAAQLACQELIVLENPAASLARGAQADAPFGPIELRALGGVRIEAAFGEEGGGLVAEAAQATYAQAADRFMLEGDARQLARLWFRSDAAQPYTPAAAQKLTHYVKAERTVIDDLRGVRYESDQNAARPAPSPR